MKHFDKAVRFTSAISDRHLIAAELSERKRPTVRGRLRVVALAATLAALLLLSTCAGILIASRAGADTPEVPEYSTPAESQPTTTTPPLSSTFSLSFTSHGDGTCTVLGLGTGAPASLSIPAFSPEGDKVIRIAQRGFEGLETVEEIILPEGITMIDSLAFKDCSALTSVVIPEGITAIAEGTFAFCENLVKIELPSTLTRIGEGAFYHSAIQRITIPDGVTEIDDFTFAYCEALQEVDLPENLQRIGRGAFSYTPALTAIDLPESLTEIGEGAFASCFNLRSIVIPSGVTEIRTATFYNCNFLIEITLPEGLTTIASHAFANLFVTEITLPSTLQSVARYAFARCNSLEQIRISEDNPFLYAVGNQIYDKATDALVAKPEAPSGNDGSDPLSDEAVESYFAFHDQLLLRWQEYERK